jgi:hypothetical protein
VQKRAVENASEKTQYKRVTSAMMVFAMNRTFGGAIGSERFFFFFFQAEQSVRSVGPPVVEIAIKEMTGSVEQKKKRRKGCGKRRRARALRATFKRRTVSASPKARKCVA